MHAYTSLSVWGVNLNSRRAKNFLVLKNHCHSTNPNTMNHLGIDVPHDCLLKYVIVTLKNSKPFQTFARIACLLDYCIHTCNVMSAIALASCAVVGYNMYVPMEGGLRKGRNT
jgi:hypothetical protein